MAKKYNIPDKNIYNYQNFDSIANNPDIDVVYVVLPPSMHKEYVIRAANAGKEVWCEKPMALTESECTAMIDACRTNKKSLAIGYRLQHEPNTQEWRALVKGQNLGKVKKSTARPATAKTAPITGSKKRRWVVEYCTIWACMLSREPD
ncbi:Gfo/Idh/MocA family protein [Puia sp. P3]|uniref:Gfo/Idh/MocA family protein n=1 Tax=Puia sp. P3 TaxID=3423952 RepID=UPI003D672ED3